MCVHLHTHVHACMKVSVNEGAAKGPDTRKHNTRGHYCNQSFSLFLPPVEKMSLSFLCSEALSSNLPALHLLGGRMDFIFMEIWIPARIPCCVWMISEFLETTPNPIKQTFCGKSLQIYISIKHMQVTEYVGVYFIDFHFNRVLRLNGRRLIPSAPICLIT